MARETVRHAGLARPLQAPETYGWWQLMLPVVLAIELAVLVILAGR